MQCTEKIIVGHLNINSIRNKFDVLSFIIDTNIDILLILETKLDHSFSLAQFRLKGFCIPYRLDRNSKEGGLFLYFCEDIPSRFLNSGSTCNIQTMSVEINLTHSVRNLKKTTKWRPGRSLKNEEKTFCYHVQSFFNFELIHCSKHQMKAYIILYSSMVS